MLDFSNLNNMQQEAVNTTNGPLLILAGAGSGKTTVLINRIANIVDLGLALPWQILAITFTNKAAGELKERLQRVLGDGGKEVNAATFHSACLRFLRNEGKNPTIYDTDDSLRVIKNILKEKNLSEKMFPPRMLLSQISKSKEDPDAISLEQIREIADLYKKKLEEANAMDFDDIIIKTIKMFEDNPEILKKYQNRYKYVMVDEYQDTDKAQFKLVKLLSGIHNNICVVGDDDQSIYAFRGATIENILNFEENFANAKVIRLEQNYRSTQNILSAANEVISNNVGRKGKNLWTNSGFGSKIKLYITEDERSEASKIAKDIVMSHRDGVPYSDNAVLYRINAQSQTIESTFVTYNIPYKIVGGQRFFDRKEIKDILAYLSVINNTNDTLRIERIINEPKRGIGAATLNAVYQISDLIGLPGFEIMQNADKYAPLSKKSEALKNFAKLITSYQEKLNDLTVSELITEVLETSGYKAVIEEEGISGQTRLENIEELKTMASHYQEESEDRSLTGFLQDISLYTDLDDYDETEDKATLMTMHSAKGLEFNHVFLPGLEEGIFPSSKSMFDSNEIEEERRLCYVAITRAKKDLTLLSTRRRMLFGRTNYSTLSRFVNEISENLLEIIDDAPQRIVSKSVNYRFDDDDFIPRKKETSSSYSKEEKVKSIDFNVGDKVVHSVFGSGVILSVMTMGGDKLLEIDFEKIGKKKIMATFAKLERG